MGAPAPTLSQLKEDAGWFRSYAKDYRHLASLGAGLGRKAYLQIANRYDRAADLLDSLEEETVTTHDEQHRSHTKRRFVGPWSKPEIEQADLRGCVSPSRPLEQPKCPDCGSTDPETREDVVSSVIYAGDQRHEETHPCPHDFHFPGEQPTTEEESNRG